MNRRHALAIIGLAGAGGAGLLEATGVVDVDGALADVTDAGDTDEIGSPTATAGEPFQSRTAALLTEIDAATTPDASREFAFDYAGGTFDGATDAYVARLVAEPRDDGDRLRVVPGEPTPTELADLLRDVWGVGAETTYEATVGDATVTFRGGAIGELSALVAAVGDTVLVARARDRATAERLADSFEPPTETP